MGYERLWERLFEFLNGWTTATEVEPGRIEVVLANSDGSSRVVEILMTRNEWDQMVTIPHGDFDLAAQAVRNVLLRLRPDEGFLIFGDYELIPSTASTLPIDPEDAVMEELARQHPEGFGRWVVLDRDGRVVDEFAPPAD